MDRVWLALLLTVMACEGTPARAPDTGTGGTGGQGAPSCGNGCVAEADEDCDACWSALLDCCYTEDERVNADPIAMAAVCSGSATCRNCCNECAARSCDEHKAAGDCPNL